VPDSYLDLVLQSTPSFVYPLNEASAPPASANGGVNLGDPGGANSPVYNQAGPSLLDATPDASIYFNPSGDLKYLFGPNMSSGDAFDLNQGNFTLEAWVIPGFDPGSPRSAMQVNYSTSSNYVLGCDASNQVMGFGGATATGAVITAPGWWHIAFVRTGTSGQVFINGVASGAAVGGQANGVGFTGIALHVGLAPGGSQRWGGNMAWIAGYKSALSAATLLSHYESQAA
jgi:hypothetical protein